MPSAAPEPPAGTDLARLIGPDAGAAFGRTLDRLGVGDGGLGIAVSGGPDSVALLLLCAADPALAGRIAAATVDHGLRPESADEARQVAALCGRLGIPHTTLAVTVAPARGGLQSAARDARYAALAGWCPGRWLLTAHHRDDVAEGLLMRLARGSGVRGLARMAEAAPLGPGALMLARPLLDWSKADLLDICERAGVRIVRDPSNDDPRFDRTAARALLARSPWLDPGRLARSAANLADADAALDWLAARCWAERVMPRDDGFALDPDGLPHDTKRRLVERIVAAIAGPDRDRRVEGLVRLLDAGEPGTLAGVLARPGPVWRFRPAPPRRTG